MYDCKLQKKRYDMQEVKTIQVRQKTKPNLSKKKKKKKSQENTYKQNKS